MSDFRAYLDEVDDLLWSYFLMVMKTVKSSHFPLFPEEPLLQLDLWVLQRQRKSFRDILLSRLLTGQKNGYTDTPTLHMTKAIIIWIVPIPKP